MNGTNIHGLEDFILGGDAAREALLSAALVRSAWLNVHGGRPDDSERLLEALMCEGVFGLVDVLDDPVGGVLDEDDVYVIVEEATMRLFLPDSWWRAAEDVETLAA